ncbi:LamG domain-containing protein [Streptomyces sp. NPDC049936]|uniref:LamG domain-containing protein n=1 Tax=Streptomyces sp. NPDC049936 TaxID=3365599 RepID=UPI0037BBB60A
MATLIGPVQQAAASDGRTVQSAEKSEERRALAEAERTGRRVEVTGERSERTSVFANPDGSTFTLEESAVPVRVAKPEGGWQKPDATLVVRTDGSVAPRAAATEMTFSRGGSGEPLVSIENQGRSLELAWPGKLPKPKLDGTSAVYANVLPDVDLKVTATVESFQHVLVVKTPKAAADKRLRELTFGLKTRGLTVRRGAAGNLAAVDANGRTVFKAPPAQMWDSAGKSLAGDGEQRNTTGTSPAAKGAASLVASTTREPADSSEVAPSGSGRAPGQGDKVSRMDVKLGRNSLSVVPDAAMLTGTAPTAFPLFIDPTVTWGESERTLLRSDGYESYGWGNGDDNRGMGAGKCGSWSGYYCGPGYVQRLYFEFSPASLKGKNVLDATFRVTEPWAFQCDPRWVDLVRTNNISSSTTWSSRPKELDWMVDRHVSAGRGSLCDPNSPDAPIEFNDNPEETNENLTPTVKSFAAGNFSRLTLEIRAHDESDTSAWKRFRNDAVLAVKYVGLPVVPQNVGLVSGSGTVCSPNSGDPATMSDPTPLVTGKPATASGGESGANLRIRWRTEKWNGTGWVPAHTDVDSPTSGYVGNRVVQSRSLPTLSEGVGYRLRALTLSYYEGGSHRLNSGYSSPCYFKVDPTAPKAPTIRLSAPYSECTSDSCVAGGGPGVPVVAAFVPATGDTNITDFQYRSTETATWTSVCKPGSPCVFKATIEPQRSGTHRLFVRAKDSVGRWGAQQVIDYLVAAGDGPNGRWHFDEASGVALDSATAAGATKHNMTLSSNATRDDRGRRGVLTHDAAGVPLASAVTDRGLVLNGTDSHAGTGSAVLEPRSSYTVSAWVRLDDRSKNQIVLSQDGTANSAFMLSYQIAEGYSSWFFGVKRPNGLYGGQIDERPARAGVWTHVAGTYDATADEVELFVNGSSVGVQEGVEAAIEPAGPLRVGLVQASGKYYQPFGGSIDEVTTWQRTLSDTEIADEARLLTSESFAGVELVADWNAADGSLADTASGYGRNLTLAGGATLSDGKIALDGVDGAATVAGPLVDDTGSFTVTTLATLDGTELAAKPVGYVGQILGQRTADGSAWGLWYQITGKDTVLDETTFEERSVPVGKWHFGRLNADGTFSSVVSDELAATDTPVRLTGIYDAQAKAISLYLGHNQNGAATAFTAKVGSSDFAIGKGFTSGAWGHYLPGGISEVRLWAGAMASSEQVETTVGD